MSGTRVNKTKLLKKVIEDTFWMARRYAHGRHTYAPQMVRDSYKLLKKHFPSLVPKHDIVIYPITDVYLHCEGDSLYDCNE